MACSPAVCLGGRVVTMEALSYRLEGFEGPLDLLLHLLARHKMSIFDIEISVLLTQYLQQIEEMQRQNLDVSSEFLEMAARLVYLKTVSLLPRPEEARSLQQELESQLADYQQYRKAAQELAGRFTWDALVRPPEPLEVDLTYRRKHEPQELVAAYQAAVGRGRRFLPPPVERFSAIAARRMVSVSSQAVTVLRLIRREHKVEYARLFAGKTDKSQLVATFLAVLELVKHGRVRVEDSGGGSVVSLTDKPARKEVGQ